MKIWHPEELVPQPQGYISIPLNRIRPPEGAIRKNFTPIGKLKRSIGRKGVLQPLCVRPVDPEWRKFEPIIGCRRYLAAKKLRLKTVPCYIKPNVKKDAIAAIALEENRCRKDLTLKELHRAIDILKDEGYPIKRISEIAGMGPDRTMAFLKLSSMPKEVQSALFRKNISVGHLVLLATFNDNEKVLNFFGRIKRENLSVSAAKQLIQHKRLYTPSSKPSKRLLDKNIRRLIGKKLFLGEGGRGVFLKIRVNDKRELLQIFRHLSGSIGLLCSMPWSTKPRKIPRARKVPI